MTASFFEVGGTSLLAGKPPGYECSMGDADDAAADGTDNGDDAANGTDNGDNSDDDGDVDYGGGEDAGEYEDEHGAEY